MVSVKEAYIKGTDILEKENIESYRLDARVLLENILKLDSGKLPLYYDKILTENEEKEYESAILKRAKHIPLSYITNKKEFYSIEFYIKEGVLIPRGDTEILVSEALKEKKKKIADVCSGSGCIGLTIAKLQKDSEVTLFDISPVAIEVAEKNIELLGIKNAKVIKKDILKEDLSEKYDLIVSNPPYIPKRDIEGLERTVKDYEPISALTDGDDGLTFYKRLKELSEKHLNKGGAIFLEIGIDQLNDVKDIFGEIEYIRDLAGIPRVIKRYL